MTQLQQSIFKKSSKTYYYSTLFFPKEIRPDIYKLYAFVRTADDYVDTIPQDSKSFYAFQEESLTSLDMPDIISDNPIISGFVEIYKKYDFKKEWVESFLKAMESDLSEVRIANREELEVYMNGSAAMVGYMMCAIFGVRDSESLHSAKMLAYSMQLINFIRDVQEDNELGRKYLYPISGIHYDDSIEYDDNLEQFIHAHLGIYHNYRSEAQIGLQSLPFSFRIPVMTASKMYEWTAGEIEKNPSVIFEKKVKPSKLHVITQALLHFFTQGMRIFSSSKS